MSLKERLNKLALRRKSEEKRIEEAKQQRLIEKQKLLEKRRRQMKPLEEKTSELIVPIVHEVKENWEDAHDGEITFERIFGPHFENDSDFLEEAKVKYELGWDNYYITHSDWEPRTAVPRHSISFIMKLDNTVSLKLGKTRVGKFSLEDEEFTERVENIIFEGLVSQKTKR